MSYFLQPGQFSKGFDAEVPLYWPDVNDECTVIIIDEDVKTLPRYYAVFVSIPQECSARRIYNGLLLENATFIFIHREGLASNGFSDVGMRSPYFPIDSNKNKFVTELQRFDAKVNSKDIMLSISIPHENTVSEIANTQYFYSAASKISYEQIQELSEVTATLRDYITFEPIMALAQLPVNGNSEFP